MAMDAPTIATYRSALYSIEQPDRPTAVLRVGQHSPELAALYREHGAASMGFITACNPLGEVVSDAANADAMAALLAEVTALGLVVLPGVGRDGDPASSWPGEPSLAVLGIGRQQAAELGRRHRQNAIIWAGADAVPALDLLAAESHSLREGEPQDVNELMRFTEDPAAEVHRKYPVND